MGRIIFLFLTLSSLSVIVFAQDEPVTWPPNADDIFSDHVTILAAEDTSYVMSRVLEDNETKTISIEENGIVTRSIPYPSSLDSIEHAQLQPDGTLLVAVSYDDNSRLYQYLVYNPTSGELSPAPTVCGGYLPDTSTEPQWAFVDDNSGKYLCNTTTDERYGPLPEDVHWLVKQWDTLADVTTSPDGEWVVLTATQPTESYYSNFEYYSLELAMSKLTYLGTINYDMLATYPPQFSEWVSETLGSLLYATDMEGNSDGFYVFNVTKPDSLQLGIHAWVRYYDNPPRYEYTDTDQFTRHKTGSVPQEHINCSLMIYDANGLRNFDLGYDCGRYSTDPFDCTTSLHRVGDDYIYLKFDEDPTVVSSVVWLDAETGETHSLLDGEIEALVDVSPDGRYFAVVGGHTGKIDAVDNWCNTSMEYVENESSLYIAAGYDVLYEAFGFVNFGAKVYWGESTITITAESTQQGFPVTLDGNFTQVRSNQWPWFHVLGLSDTGELRSAYILRSISPTSIQAVSPSQEQFIIGERQSSLYDVHSHDFLPVIDAENAILDLYTHYYVWDESGLKVIISNKADYRQQMIYHITVDTLP